MNALRVAFVDQIGSTAGGAEETLATFLKHVPAGIDPSVLLFEDGAFAQRLRALGLPVAIVPVPAAIGSTTRERLGVGAAVRIPAVAWHVARLLKSQRIDVVYSNSMKAHFIAGPAARLAGRPCVMHFHDLVEGAALFALRSAALAGSRERIACSRAVSAHLAMNATSVIYGPVELNAYESLPDRHAARTRLGLPLDGPLVSIVGRINRWKGVDRFVRIAARVSAAVPAHFAIVGAPIFRDADVVPELERLVASLGLRDRITFVPWLDDVRTIYAATDVNANCSTREPFGRAIVEAAACGVPTVCFDDSGAAETIVDNVSGRTIRFGDEAAFAGAVVRYLSEPVTLADARRTVRALAARFDAPLIAAEMADVIRRAAA